MSETARAGHGGIAEPETGLDGLRAAMYAEMAAAAAGKRPWCEREAAWDAALEGAVQFLDSTAVDDRLARNLLGEAAATRMAGDLHDWTTPVDELCTRLAAEFRRRVGER